MHMYVHVPDMELMFNHIFRGWYCVSAVVEDKLDQENKTI